MLCGWVLAAFAASTAHAVEPADAASEFAVRANDGDEYAGASEGAFWQPVQYAEPGPGAGPMPMGNPYFGGEYPPTAWPGISPYETPEFSQTFNDGGIWQHEDRYGIRKYLYSAEMLITSGLRPGTQLIGAAGIPAATQHFAGETDIFPQQTTATFANLTHLGAKLRYGWENTDDSMFIVSGFYIAQSHQAKGPLGTLQIPLGSGLQPLASIPYNNGFFGTLATFDTNWYQSFSQEAWGADADIYLSPFFRRDSFKVYLTYGVKYLRINEQFNVRARDSSQAYVVVIPPGTITNVTQTGLPELDTQINSSTISDLIGPSVGLRYDLGGNSFKIWGQSKLAVCVDMDRSRVWGQDAITFQDLIDGANTPIRFNTSKSHVHIAPVFDQSIYGEFPLFKIIPLINRLSFINQAQFRIGFNYVCAWEVARPANQIKYDEFNPSIQTNRTWFSLSTVSFAADWRF